MAHPETVPLHDILWHLDEALAADDADEAARRVGALALWVARAQHPEREAVRVLLSLVADDHDIVPAPVTVEARLVEAGWMAPGEDPVVAVDRALTKTREVERALEDRVLELEGRYVAAARTANVLAGVSAFLLGGLVITLLVSTGVVEVNWMDPPTLEEGQDDAAD